MPHQLQNLSSAESAIQWNSLLESISLLENASFHRSHERYLTQYGCEFMAHVYQHAIERVLEVATCEDRLELCSAFRRVMSQAIDTHFMGLESMDLALRLSLADNAKQWLAFLHSMALADKISFNNIHVGFLGTYGADFMARAYRATFEHVLQSVSLHEPGKIMAAFQQSLNQALEARPPAAQA